MVVRRGPGIGSHVGRRVRDGHLKGPGPSRTSKIYEIELNSTKQNPELSVCGCVVVVYIKQLKTKRGKANRGEAGGCLGGFARQSTALDLALAYPLS